MGSLRQRRSSHNTEQQRIPISASCSNPPKSAHQTSVRQEMQKTTAVIFSRTVREMAPAMAARWPSPFLTADSAVQHDSSPRTPSGCPGSQRMAKKVVIDYRHNPNESVDTSRV